MEGELLSFLFGLILAVAVFFKIGMGKKRSFKERKEDYEKEIRKKDAIDISRSDGQC